MLAERPPPSVTVPQAYRGLDHVRTGVDDTTEVYCKDPLEDNVVNGSDGRSGRAVCDAGAPHTPPVMENVTVFQGVTVLGFTT